MNAQERFDDLKMALETYERLYFDTHGPLYKSDEVLVLIRQTLNELKRLKENIDELSK